MNRLPIAWLGEEPDAPFPPLSRALTQPDGLLAAGGDLSVTRLVHAYRRGIFPWYMPGEPILWWSPDPRCVFATGEMHVPRRLARDLRKLDWTVTANRRFGEVLERCAERESHGTWITHEMDLAYRALHRAGHAHSIEVVDADARIVGGLYGVAIGRMFFAESMFSVQTHGSKVALLALAARLSELGYPIIDAQVASPHLFTLGAKLVRRREFAAAIEVLTALPPAPAFEPFPTVTSLATRWPRASGSAGLSDDAR